jgi:hypothetical protein
LLLILKRTGLQNRLSKTCSIQGLFRCESLRKDEQFEWQTRIKERSFRDSLWSWSNCQENSEFWPQKMGIFLKWKRFWCENGQNLTFSEVVDSQPLPFSLHLFDLQKLCFGAVRAML